MKVLVPGRKGIEFFGGFALLLLGPVSAAEPAGFSSHAPMRPLPTPSKQPLAKGTLFFVDAAKGDDKNDGSAAKPWKTVQHSGSCAPISRAWPVGRRGHRTS
jgi:hypothetical protein